MKLLGTILAIWNFAVFVMYGSDKIRAKHNVRRISEKTLLLSAFFLGGIGAFFGMQIFLRSACSGVRLRSFPGFTGDAGGVGKAV